MFYSTARSSNAEVFYKNSVLKNFSKFTGKKLYQSLLFKKVAGSACNFIKKGDSGPGVFLWILQSFKN